MVRKKRRSDRVCISLPIEVSGTDVEGHDFHDVGQTLVVSRHGARIILNRKLAPEQVITIRRIRIGKAAEFRVLGRIGGQAHQHIYGVTFHSRPVNLWGIGFPPLDEAEKALGRILLECRHCKAREVTYLNELEMEVFEANRHILRQCKHCQESTFWEQTAREAPAKQEPPLGSAVAAAAPDKKERRKEMRAKLRSMACILQGGFGEEVLATEDVSRSGLSFKSRRHYLEGSRIEVAIPYTVGAANIFVPGRVVYARELPTIGMFRHGIKYIDKEGA